jgi:hypothetical protein
MLGGILETLMAVYEVATVVTDVVLNAEYIKRKWLEEYILSIVFLVVNGLVMGLVGVGLEAAYPNRYTRVDFLNKAVGFLISLLQLRVLTETAYAATASAQTESSHFPGLLTDHTEDGSAQGTSTAADTAQQTARQAKKERANQLAHGLLYVAFVQSVVRDMPIFILQANATIHYRKWKTLDVLAVVLTALSLLRGVAAYVGKKDKGIALSLLTLTFLSGQFVFRLGVILLVAMTKGYVIVAYGLAITVFAIASTAALRLAHPSHDLLAQLPRAIVFFPFFTFFVIDGSVLSARFGSAFPALRSPKLLYVHAWRCIENVVGVILAVTMPRYTDFGVSTDGQIVLIGCICAAVYVVSFALFWLLLPLLDKTSGEEKNSAAGEHANA